MLIKGLGGYWLIKTKQFHILIYFQLKEIYTANLNCNRAILCCASKCYDADDAYSKTAFNAAYYEETKIWELLSTELWDWLNSTSNWWMRIGWYCRLCVLSMTWYIPYSHTIGFETYDLIMCYEK